MPILHVEKLRSGERSEDEYHLVETAGLPAWDAEASLTVVGRPHPRVEGVEKVTGRARYAADIRLPGLLYARVLRSPLPHARVRRVDIARAEALPGVRAVVCASNTPPIPWYHDSFLFDSAVRFVGDEVAAVAADTEDIAEDALRLIAVDYEPLPCVVDMHAALQPGMPTLRDSGHMAGEPKVYQRGDIEGGFRQADVIIDAVYTTQTALHNSLESHGCTATWDGDRLTLWDSTQSVFEVREQVADALKLPEHHVRVIKQHMGGGFGSKQVAWKHTVIAALLAKQAGRPVQLTLDREAENLAAGNRNATRQHVRLGARRDGTVTAISVRIEQQVGAYMVGGEASNVSGPYQRLYRCPNVRTEQVGVYTNTGPAVAFRAPGFVEGAFGLESAMDELARALQIDPLDLRLRNYASDDQLRSRPYTSPDSLRHCYERAAEAFGWRSDRRPASSGPKRRGIGMAAHDWGGSGYPPAYAWVKLNADGTAEVITGTQDIGTGTRTGLTQVAAEELGLPLERVTLYLGDTALGPYAPVSAGSATQATLGPAVRAAAADAKGQLLKAAAACFETDPARLSVANGRILRDGREADGLAIEDVTRRIAPHMILGHGARGPNPEGKSVRTFGAQCVEVEVDVETGEVTVLRIVAAHDCGRIINPTMVDSQVIGAVTQGLGFALMEERILDARSGVVLNANLEEYKVPTVADVPAIVHAHVDIPDPEANPTGAKGIGEPPLVPTAPALANAVFDAVGVRIRRTPLSRHRILEALAQIPAQPQPSPLPIGGRYGEGAAIAMTPTPQAAEPSKHPRDQGGQG
ncbi:MAG TPA: xanthine dehydrogenase family protein molybdopterin-binding subunit [Alphaproteobacteria bacterium]|nr:xanthine dehydrogenase family protein molybdopterin-binding subunit [Alphaproteobacteria bacterium]